MVQPISCTRGPHHHQKSRSFFKHPIGRTLRYPQHKIPYFTEPPTTPSAVPGGITSPTMSIEIRSPITRDFVLYEIPYRIKMRSESDLFSSAMYAAGSSTHSLSPSIVSKTSSPRNYVVPVAMGSVSQNSIGFNRRSRRSSSPKVAICDERLFKFTHPIPGPAFTTITTGGGKSARVIRC